MLYVALVLILCAYAFLTKTLHYWTIANSLTLNQCTQGAGVNFINCNDLSTKKLYVNFVIE